jgi:HK97 gp10 family phage protein
MDFAGNHVWRGVGSRQDSDVMSKVTGHRQTAAAIRKLARLPQGVVGKASRKAMAPILRAAKANLRKNKSYKRGVLSRSLVIRKLRGTTSLSQWVIAASGRGIGISALVEFGTAPHWQPKRGRMHPGARAKPFLTPAFEAHDDQAVKIMVDELGKGIMQHARAVAYRGK